MESKNNFLKKKDNKSYFFMKKSAIFFEK